MSYLIDAAIYDRPVDVGVGPQSLPFPERVLYCIVDRALLLPPGHSVLESEIAWDLADELGLTRQKKTTLAEFAEGIDDQSCERIRDAIRELRSTSITASVEVVEDPERGWLVLPTYRGILAVRRWERVWLHKQPFGFIRDEALRSRCMPLLVGNWPHYDTVVREACVVLEDRVRKAAGLNAKNSRAVMTEAFKSRDGAPPRLLLGHESGIQEAALQLFSGTLGFIRNPVGHNLLPYSQADALRIVAFIDWLLELVDDAQEQRDKLLSERENR